MVEEIIEKLDEFKRDTLRWTFIFMLWYVVINAIVIFTAFFALANLMKK
jgi:hypothetical protein